MYDKMARRMMVTYVLWSHAKTHWIYNSLCATVAYSTEIQIDAWELISYYSSV